MCLYTDGSKIPSAPFVEYALVSLGDVYLRPYKTLGLVSSYGTEVMAIIDALNLGLERHWPALTIFTDSLSVITAVGARFHTRATTWF